MQTEPAYPIYQIKIEGHLGPGWSTWFDSFRVIQAGENPGCTTITGSVPDQAALRGILNKLWDLNLTLISINRLT